MLFLIIIVLGVIIIGAEVKAVSLIPTGEPEGEKEN